VPAWPPYGDRGAVPFPAARTPAGAYLPPSAVLPPLDAPGRLVAASARSGAGGAVSTTAVDRSMASIGEFFGSVHIADDVVRRTVGIGAGIASIAFPLPWINGLPGAGLSGYLDRWGLAGPGLWIIAAASVALAAIALSSGRSASWPVALPAIVLGSLMFGLLWPSIFGGGASIGVWVGLVGAIVLLVAGVLDLRSRHEGEKPAV